MIPTILSLPPGKSETSSTSPLDVDAKKEEDKGDVVEKFFCADVVNVSEGFQLRTAYKRKVKASRLDGLLERRVHQFTLEEKQRYERLRGQTATQVESGAGGPDQHGSVAGDRQVGVTSMKAGSLVVPSAVNSGTASVAGTEKQVSQEEEEKQSKESSGTGSPVKEVNCQSKQEDSTSRNSQVVGSPSSACNDQNVSKDRCVPEYESINERNGGNTALPLAMLTPSPDLNVGSWKGTETLPGLNSESKSELTVGTLEFSKYQKSAGTETVHCPEDRKSGPVFTEQNGEENGCLQDESMDVDKSGDDESAVKSQLPLGVQVNGDDSLQNKTLLDCTLPLEASSKLDFDKDIEEKGANQNSGNEIKVLPAQDAVKLLMNGDLLSHQSSSHSIVDKKSNTTLSNMEYSPAQKVPRLENSVKELASSSGTLLNSDVSSVISRASEECDDTTKDCVGEEDELVAPKLASSTVPPAGQSSLSNSVPLSNHSSEPISVTSSNEAPKTTITQVTTTMTTITTTISKAVAVSKDSAGTPAMVSISENKAVSLLTTTSTTVTTTVTGGGATTMTVSREYSTRDRVRLLRFSRSKKARSGTALPSYRKFVTKSSKKSIFVLPNDELRKLARQGGIREVPIFNYNAKPALDIWPYPSPRPTFSITWRLACCLC